MQPVQLGATVRAPLEVLPRGGATRLQAGFPQLQQLLHFQMCHTAVSSPSQRRSRAWARANCDFEKLTVLPIMPAISSWV